MSSRNRRIHQPALGAVDVTPIGHDERMFALADDTPLSHGDIFKMKLTEPAATEGAPAAPGVWRYFKFLYVRTTPRGTTYVTAYGGDADPQGRRQFHSFDTDRVREHARFVRTAEQEAGKRARQQHQAA